MNIKNKYSIIITTFFVVLNTYASTPKNVEEINVVSPLKERILHSQFKVDMYRRDGKKFIAFLHSENNTSRLETRNSCITGDPLTTHSQNGKFYLYLYDPLSGKFLNYRTRIFSAFSNITFNVEGSDLTLLSGGKTSHDILLISQFGACSGDFYEAYGFSRNSLYLEKYKFIENGKEREFFGRVGGANKAKLIGYGVDGENGMPRMTLEASSQWGEVNIKDYPW
ncbi:MAG: hypothetical protein Q8M40_12140 [Legionella sp.]|nr:hypothetical protein [Legionella sp.]